MLELKLKICSFFFCNNSCHNFYFIEKKKLISSNILYHFSDSLSFSAYCDRFQAILYKILRITFILICVQWNFKIHYLFKKPYDCKSRILQISFAIRYINLRFISQLRASYVQNKKFLLLRRCRPFYLHLLILKGITQGKL